MRKGQRAFVGKVCMDRNAPADYSETTAASIRDTEAFIQVRSLNATAAPRLDPAPLLACPPLCLNNLPRLAAWMEAHVLPLGRGLHELLRSRQATNWLAVI